MLDPWFEPALDLGSCVVLGVAEVLLGCGMNEEEGEKEEEGEEEKEDAGVELEDGCALEEGRDEETEDIELLADELVTRLD